MAKQILNLGNGAFVINESSGIFTIAVDETAGGGSAKGWISGTAGVNLNATQLLQLGQAAINAHVSATLLPVVEGVEAVADATLTALE